MITERIDYVIRIYLHVPAQTYSKMKTSKVNHLKIQSLRVIKKRMSLMQIKTPIAIATHNK